MTATAPIRALRSSLGGKCEVLPAGEGRAADHAMRAGILDPAGPVP